MSTDSQDYQNLQKIFLEALELLDSYWRIVELPTI